MATCAAIQLNIEQADAVLADSYCLKLSLSEGLSAPPLAKLTLITTQALAPRQLKQVLGQAAKVTLIQSEHQHSASVLSAHASSVLTSHAASTSKSTAVNSTRSSNHPQYSNQSEQSGGKETFSCRFIQGQVQRIDFIQKVYHQLTRHGQVQQECSYVYELYLTSALHQLTLNTHTQFLPNLQQTGLTDFLERYFQHQSSKIKFETPQPHAGAQSSLDDNAQSFSEAGVISSLDAQAADTRTHVAAHAEINVADKAELNFASMLHQSNESAYALLLRYLYLKGLNYIFSHQAQGFKEQVRIGTLSTLLQSQEPQLYIIKSSLNGKASSLSTVKGNTSSASSASLSASSASSSTSSSALSASLSASSATAIGKLDATALNKLEAAVIERSFDLERSADQLHDVSYSCEGQIPLEFAFLQQEQSFNRELTSSEQRALASDPFLKWLVPHALLRNSKRLVSSALYRQLLLTKLRQLQNESEHITAAASNLVFQPGFSFELHGLGEPLSLMVTHVELFAAAPFPTDRAYPAPTCAEKTLSMRLNLINLGSFTVGVGCLLSTSSVLHPEYKFNFASLATLESELIQLNRGAAGGLSHVGQGANSLGLTGAADQSAVVYGGANSSHDLGATNNSLLSLTSNPYVSLGQQADSALLDPAIRFTPQLVTATVCTDTGSRIDQVGRDWAGQIFLTPYDNTANPALFYACLDETGELIVVERSDEQADFPRVGDRIKVLALHGRYLCLGHSSPASSQLVYSDQARLGQLYSKKLSNPFPRQALLSQNCMIQGRTQLQHPIVDAEVEDQGLGSSIQSSGAQVGLDYIETLSDLIIYHYEHGSLEHLAFHQAVQANLAIILQNYEAALPALKSAYIQMQAAQQAYEEAHEAYFRKLAEDFEADTEDLQSVRESRSDAYADSYNELYKQAAKMAEILQLTPIQGQMLANLSSRLGDIVLDAARGNISLLANQINSAGDSVSISGKTIQLSADDKLVLAVGGNTITLDRNGVAIESRKWTGMSGVLDSLILLDSISGVSISGMTTSMSGVLGVNIADGFGASIGLNAGSSKFSAVTSSMDAAGGLGLLSNTIGFGLNFVNEMISLGTTLKGSATSTQTSYQKLAYFANNDISALYRNITAIITQSNNSSPSKTNKSLATIIIGWIKCIMNLIVTLVNMVEHTMMSFFGTVLNQVVSANTPNYTVRDCIRTISSGLKFITVFSSVVDLFITVGIKENVTSINLTPTKLALDASKIFNTSKEATSANNPLAGDKAESAQESAEKAEDTEKKEEHKDAPEAEDDAAKDSKAEHDADDSKATDQDAERTDTGNDVDTKDSERTESVKDTDTSQEANDRQEAERTDTVKDSDESKGASERSATDQDAEPNESRVKSSDSADSTDGDDKQHENREQSTESQSSQSHQDADESEPRSQPEIEERSEQPEQPEKHTSQADAETEQQAHSEQRTEAESETPESQHKQPSSQEGTEGTEDTQGTTKAPEDKPSDNKSSDEPANEPDEHNSAPDEHNSDTQANATPSNQDNPDPSQTECSQDGATGEATGKSSKDTTEKSSGGSAKQFFAGGGAQATAAGIILGGVVGEDVVEHIKSKKEEKDNEE